MFSMYVRIGPKWHACPAGHEPPLTTPTMGIGLSR
jgi:hypothetical protein